MTYNSHRDTHLYYNTQIQNIFILLPNKDPPTIPNPRNLLRADLKHVPEK